MELLWRDLFFSWNIISGNLNDKYVVLGGKRQHCHKHDSNSVNVMSDLQDNLYPECQYPLCEMNSVI